jgi:hypothetical protein
MKHAGKVSMRIRRMRGKYMENTANAGLFAVLKIVSEYAESFNRIRRIRRKNLYVYGEYSKSLSAYSLTTPRDIKVCISQLIVIQILSS